MNIGLHLALCVGVQAVPGALTQQAVRGRTTTVQEITAAVANQPQRVAVTAAGTAAQVITTTTLTPAQLVAAQRVATATATSVTPGMTGSMAASQLQQCISLKFD